MKAKIIWFALIDVLNRAGRKKNTTVRCRLVIRRQNSANIVRPLKTPRNGILGYVYLALLLLKKSG